MDIWIFIIFITFYHFQLIFSTDIFTKDFKLFSTEICKFGCTKISCPVNTLISIDSIKPIQAPDSKCNQINFSYSVPPFNCYFKYFENHIFKTCSNTVTCDICLNKIESEYTPDTHCTSENDFLIKYRCIPGYIKNDNICANSYLDIDCFDTIKEKLVILNATLYPEIKSTTDDSNSCNLGIPTEKLKYCRLVDKTNHVISKCSYREKCSIGPLEYTSTKCKNMHMRLSHACVSEVVLEHFINKPIDEKQNQIKKIKTYESENETNSWFKKHKWTILGVSVSIVVTSSLIISILICFNRRNHRQQSCDISAPKDNLFNKLGQQKFTPPPSSIDKVNIEFENVTLAPPDIYNSNSDNEEAIIRSIYSPNIHSTLSYSSQFCNAPPSINTCQYFSPLLQPGHINMLEMPAIQLASSGNLTSSTINSSHGTPRGTKSSGIFSMTDMSFENTHLV